MNYFEEKHNKYEAFSTLKAFCFYILSKYMNIKYNLTNQQYCHSHYLCFSFFLLTFFPPAPLLAHQPQPAASDARQRQQ